MGETNPLRGKLGTSGSILDDVGPPEIPAGPPVSYVFERPVAAFRACSSSRLVCVHTDDGDDANALRVLTSAEQALTAFTALGLPLPRIDGPLGGDAALDIYLSPDVQTPLRAASDPPLPGAFDTSTTFIVGASPNAAGCLFDAEVARAVAQASLLAHDSAVHGGVMAMATSHLANTIAPCAIEQAEAMDAFQRSPERALVDINPMTASGAALFPQFLDEEYGSGTPGLVIASLIAISSQKSPDDQRNLQNEPDLFDALRRNARDVDGSLSNMLLDFAVQRAFVGSRSDGAHLLDTAWFGDLGRVRFEWAVPYSSLPRRLAPLRPIEATGMTYLWLDLKDAPPDAEITFAADWESPVLFRWALVRVDKDGGERGRMEVGGVYGSTHAQQTLVDLDDLSGILIVGMNLGDLNRAYPYDPDDMPFAPHDYTVTLYGNL